MPASQRVTAAATAGVSFLSPWSPATCTTSRPGAGSGMPNRSLSPCTTSTGTETASSSSMRVGPGGFPARGGGWSGKARHSTPADPVCAAVRQATRAPAERPPVTSGTPASFPEASSSTTAAHASSSLVGTGPDFFPATR